MEKAIAGVKAGKADAVIVTCHAVLHELYDRSHEKFNVLTFFAKIFSDPEIPTLFTYREPGAPEKWPDGIVMQAACSPESLLSLARAIMDRHKDFTALQPTPIKLGDGILVHKNLGMEILAKLFYLKDLRYEIEERVTILHHEKLQSALWAAVGERARLDHLAEIEPYSAPTKSFIAKWHELKVCVSGLDESFAICPLTISVD